MTRTSLPKELAAVLAVAAVSGFVFNAFSPDGIPLVRTPPLTVQVSDDELFGAGPPTPPAAGDTAADRAGRSGEGAGSPAPDPGPPPQPTDNRAAGAEPADRDAGSPEPTVFRVITLEQMQRVVREGRGMLVDARTPAEYARARIAGAVNMYAAEPEGFVERLAELPRDTMIVIYCTNTHCPFGRDLAEFLSAFSFTNLLLYDDGWDGWTSAGLPVEEGEGER